MVALFEFLFGRKLRHNRKPMPIEPTQERLLTTEEAAALTGYNVQQIRDMIRGGVFDKDKDLKRVGQSWLIKESALAGKRPRKKGRQKK